jgi:glucose-1-phosphate thymidylyltransferase
MNNGGKIWQQMKCLILHPGRNLGVNMKGIILHGGYGTRLRPLTYSRPKQLLPIANIPMSQYGLSSLVKSGISEIAIIIGGENSNKVKEYYKNGDEFNVKITYVHQDEPRGISHAISLCKDFVGNEKFVVFLGDNILVKEITEYVEDFKNSNDDGKILLCEVSNPQQFGVIEINSDGSIKKIMEKPKNPPTNLAVIGVYFLTPKFFDVITDLKPSARGELEITDALQLLLDSHYKISYDKITNYWKDTGTPSDIIDANNTILSQMKSYFFGSKEENVQLGEPSMIGTNSKLQNGVKIIGPVLIGKNCSIGPNVTIGPNVSIGDNVSIKNSDIDNSIIMTDCKIDSKMHISNSIIPYRSEISSSSSANLILSEDSKISL